MLFGGGISPMNIILHSRPRSPGLARRLSRTRRVRESRGGAEAQAVGPANSSRCINGSEVNNGVKQWIIFQNLCDKPAIEFLQNHNIRQV